MESVLKKLLDAIPQQDYITSNSLAKKLNLSEKTIRTYVHRLDEIIESNGAYIESKHGKGYRLIVEDSELFSTIEDDSVRENIANLNSTERVSFLLSFLLSQNDYISIEDLMDLLYISESTLNSDFKKIRKILKEYSLQLSIRNNKGVCILGNELDIRLCMAHSDAINLVYEKDTTYLMNKEIEDLVRDAFNINHVSIPDESIRNISIHVLTAVLRKQKGKVVNVTEERQQIRKNSPSYRIASTICNELKEKYLITLSEDEKAYLALHLSGHRVNTVGNVDNVFVSEGVVELTFDILNFINRTFKINLLNNFSCFTSLSLHISSLVVRIENRIHLRNPLLKDIKQNYPLGYTLAKQAVIIIENKYNCELSKDEVGYLAVLFEISVQMLEQKEDEIIKKNILVVCATGGASSRLVAYQYKENFEKYLDNVDICTIGELIHKDFNNYDYILATVPIDFKVPIPIIGVNLLLRDTEILNLTKRFSNDSKIKCYSEDLFFPNLEAETKEEALHKMCDRIKKVRDIPDNFYEGIMKRESFATTDLSDDLALPHPYDVETTETFAAVAILSKPVFWGNHEISIIVMISVSRGDEGRLKDFYQQTASLMFNKQKLDLLMTERTFRCLLDVLTRE